jgi:putative transposase
MPRTARVAPPGLVYHVLNRAVARMTLFRNDRDFQAFERIIIDAHERFDLRLCSYCILRNHWHFVTWPSKPGQLSSFFRWLTLTHAMRWRVAHDSVGYGPLYQSRFKSFAVEEDDAFLVVCRYVERNALSAGLVKRAEDWRYSSLWARLHGPAELRRVLSDWPVDRPRNWVARVNEPLTAREIERVRTSIARNRPLGSDQWVQRIAKRHGLEHTLRSEGRPRIVRR